MRRYLSLWLLAALFTLALAPAAEAAGPCGSRYVVQRGDTLYRIARKCGSTVDALAQANQLRNPNRIYVGQVLTIPGEAPAPGGEARVVYFRVSPTTFRPGDVVKLQWQVTGERATICPVTGGRPVAHRCVEVTPDVGVITLNTDADAVAYTGFEIRAEAGGYLDSRAVAVTVRCQGYLDWFFPGAPERCPSTAPMTFKAAAQRFERGRMLWLDGLDVFYAFLYGNPQVRQPFVQVTGPLRLKPGGSWDNRLGLTPPPGLFEPISGFGLVWRGEVEGSPALREQLGWAVEPEFGFETQVQCEAAVAYGWSCYLRTPEGTILNYSYSLYGSLSWAQK